MQAAVGMTSAAAKSAWRAHLRRGGTSSRPVLRIGVAATFTAEPLVPFLGACLLEGDVEPRIVIGPYHQISQACGDPCTFFGGECEVVVLAWRLDDLMLSELHSFLSGKREAWDLCLGKVAWLRNALSTLRARFHGTIVVTVPPVPEMLPAGSMDLDFTTGLGALHRAVINAFVEEFPGTSPVYFWDLDSVQRSVGLSSSHDARQWYLYRQPFTDAFLLAAGHLLSRIILTRRRVPCKCIIVDCDNTLWGGIVGEDGVAGIQIGGDFPGTAYEDFQQLLLHWRSRGILLAMTSKNTEADVWEVFDHRSEMLLRREHFSAWKINWATKVDNIVEIAILLNIGLDSMVFVDDNPLEIDLVRERLPEVRSVLLPRDPADIMQHLRALTMFDQIEVTNEDRGRAVMLQSEEQRRRLSATVSKEEFQRSLELRLELVNPQWEVVRITQLVNRTNQFNLSGIRRSLNELRQIIERGSMRVYALKVSDRFGEYGITGVAIVDACQAGEWNLDTFLLSCRILGRGVETAFLARVVADALVQGVERMNARYVATAKNRPAADFLPAHGFLPSGDGLWTAQLTDVPDMGEKVISTVL